MSDIRRRAFMTLLGGAAAAWPRSARGQQGERMRRIGVLMNLGSPEADPVRGRQVGRAEPMSTLDAELNDFGAQLAMLGGHAAAPDVILAGGGAVVPSLLQATRTVPIVFTGTPDPVGAGFVE